jgi:hypothetical protein
MLIDFNSLAKVCYDERYETPASFDTYEDVSDDNVQEAYKYLGMMEDNNSYFEFRGATIELLKTLFRIAHLRQINLNDFFKISLNLKE